jgi:hypothetical protein
MQKAERSYSCYWEGDSMLDTCSVETERFEDFSFTREFQTEFLELSISDTEGIRNIPATEMKNIFPQTRFQKKLTLRSPSIKDLRVDSQLNFGDVTEKNADESVTAKIILSGNGQGPGRFLYKLDEANKKRPRDESIISVAQEHKQGDPSLKSKLTPVKRNFGIFITRKNSGTNDALQFKKKCSLGLFLNKDSSSHNDSEPCEKLSIELKPKLKENTKNMLNKAAGRVELHKKDNKEQVLKTNASIRQPSRMLTQPITNKQAKPKEAVTSRNSHQKAKKSMPFVKTTLMDTDSCIDTKNSFDTNYREQPKVTISYPIKNKKQIHNLLNNVIFILSIRLMRVRRGMQGTTQHFVINLQQENLIAVLKL